MGGHQSRESTYAVAQGSPSLAVLVCLVIAGAAASGCRVGETQREALSRETAPAGLFRPRSAYRAVRQIRIVPDGTGRWIAFQEGDTRLRVWSVDDDATLGPVLFDSKAADFTPRRLAWAGTTLLYMGWKGQVDLRRLEVFPPPGGRRQYLADRAFGAAWDAVTGTQTQGVPNGFLEAVADRSGHRVAVFDDLPAPEHRERGQGNYVRLLRMPGYELEGRFEFHLGDDIEPEVGDDAWVLAWHPVEEGFYVVSKCMAPVAPGDPQKLHYPRLTFVDLDGHVRGLSDDKDPRLAQTWRYGVPAISLVEGDTAVAGFVEHWQGGSGVAVYDLGGLRREWGFGVHDPFPPKLREVSPGWRFIICTSDGKRALFQERLDYYNPQDSRRPPWWVYAWDLEHETYEPIAQMSKIEYCFGWLSDTALIVGAQAEDPEAAERELYDYGVLHLTKTEQ